MPQAVTVHVDEVGVPHVTLEGQPLDRVGRVIVDAEQGGVPSVTLVMHPVLGEQTLRLDRADVLAVPTEAGQRAVVAGWLDQLDLSALTAGLLEQDMATPPAQHVVNVLRSLLAVA